MNQSLWYKSRSLLLILCSFGLVSTLFYIVVKPQKDTFDALPMMSKWESIENHKIKVGDEGTEGKKYQEQDNHNLGIEIILIPVLHGGNLGLIKSHLGFDMKSQDLTIVEDKDTGAYGLFTKNNSAYLSTCLHSQGKVAFNTRQFAELVNHNLANRILPWVLGLSDFRDWRCYWINMSVDLENITPEEAAQLLQKKLFDIISQAKFR